MIQHYISSKPFRITIISEGEEPQTQIAHQRPVEPDGSRLDSKWHLNVYTLSLSGNTTIEIEPLQHKKGEKKPVFIYESNAGHLFLWKQSDPHFYQEDPFQTGATIHQSARAIYDGETNNWSEEWVHPVSQLESIMKQCHTIAAWYPAGYVEYYEPAGPAGKKFLGIDDPDDKDI